MKTAIVLPIYNEEKQISKVLNDLTKVKLPLIAINDGSTDKTLQKLKSSKIAKLKILTHEINLGKGGALKTGCDYAFSNGFDAVVLMDSDGQHDVDEVGSFLKKLNDGYDIVFGSRNLNPGVPLDRYLGNKMASILVNVLFGIYISDLNCGYKAFTKNAYSKVKWNSKGYSVETEIAIRTKKNKLKYCEVPVSTIYYDSFKGVSIMEAFGVFWDILKWYLVFK